MDQAKRAQASESGSVSEQSLGRLKQLMALCHEMGVAEFSNQEVSLKFHSTAFVKKVDEKTFQEQIERYNKLMRDMSIENKPQDDIMLF